LDLEEYKGKRVLVDTRVILDKKVWLAKMVQRVRMAREVEMVQLVSKEQLVTVAKMVLREIMVKWVPLVKRGYRAILEIKVKQVEMELMDLLVWLVDEVKLV
jgi:hypothetical protein